MRDNEFIHRLFKIVTRRFVKFELLVYFVILASKYLLNIEVFIFINRQSMKHFFLDCDPLKKSVTI